MLRKSRRQLLLLAAISSLPVLNSSAWAQYQRTQSPGRLTDNQRILDANNLVGSHGYNTGYREDPGLMSGLRLGNQVVTGNVTGGRAFRGFVPYTDPFEFRGAYAGRGVDTFIRDSAGAGATYQPPAPVSVGTPFYGHLATPPSGFTTQGFTGTYTPAPPSQSGALQGPRANPTPLSVGPVDSSLAQPDLNNMTGVPRTMSASELLGLQSLKTSDYTGREFLAQYQAMGADADRFRLDSASIRRMREQLSATAEQTGSEKADESGNLSKPLAPPPDAPIDAPLGARQTPGSLAATPMRTALTLPKSEQNVFKPTEILPPWKQSEQYAEMEKRVRLFYEDLAAKDQGRNKDVLDQLHNRDAADRADSERERTSLGKRQGLAEPPTSRPSLNDAGVPDYGKIARELLGSSRSSARGAVGTTAAPADAGNSKESLAKPAPVRITSLANTVKKGELSQMLAKADELMKNGKFVEAIRQIEAAEVVVPNNPIVALARAHAELGAGFYTQAEASIRAALTDNPVVLIAQFDLMRMIGAKRLGEIVNDLKEASVKQPDDPTIMLLLAYVAYNSGYGAQAGHWLSEADTRAKGTDPLYGQLRDHWLLVDSPRTPSPTTRPGRNSPMQ